MSDVLGIFIIALGVVGLGLAAWFVRLFIDGRKQRRKMHERRVEDAEREERMGEHMEREFVVCIDGHIRPAYSVKDDDSTVTLPVIDERLSRQVSENTPAQTYQQNIPYGGNK